MWRYNKQYLLHLENNNKKNKTLNVAIKKNNAVFKSEKTFYKINLWI